MDTFVDPLADLFLTTLREPLAATAYAVTARLTAAFPDRALIEGAACSFAVLQYAKDGHCTFRFKTDAPLSQISTYWQSGYDGIGKNPENLWIEADWQGHTFDVVLMAWPNNRSQERRFWILAETEAAAIAFYEAVCAWAAEVRGEVLVYENGEWSKSEALFRAIQSAGFDNLVLPPALKNEVRDDLTRFFDSRAQYERYNIPWKRGVLLIGPPGNGKTHCIKALVNHLGKPCLYVKSVKSIFSTEEANISAVFERARKAPCVLVLEDLDSLINDENRAFFLNELDGFASNVGILTLATTNHPERLDPAIVDRPSRFDRKYHFPLPEGEERQSYIALWNDTLQSELQITGAEIVQIADLTGEFSFAYLKELFVSSLMRWINTPRAPGGMNVVMQTQVALLREQMATEKVGSAREETAIER